MTLQSPPNVDLYIIDLYIITKDVTTSTSKTTTTTQSGSQASTCFHAARREKNQSGSAGIR